MEEMTEEELDLEIERKRKLLSPEQRRLLDSVEWFDIADEEALLNERLKEAKHRLWTEVINDENKLDKLVEFIKANMPCSLCHKKGVMLTRVIEGDRMFICEDCILRNQKQTILKVYKSDHTIGWEWKND